MRPSDYDGWPSHTHMHADVPCCAFAPLCGSKFRCPSCDPIGYFGSVYLNSILRDQKLKIYRSNLLPFLSSEGQLRDFDLLANFTDRKLWLPGMDGVNNWGRGADCWSVDHILAQKIQNGYKASLEDMMRMLEMTLTQFHLHDLWS